MPRSEMMHKAWLHEAEVAGAALIYSIGTVVSVYGTFYAGVHPPES